MSVAVAEMEIVSFPIPTDLPDEVINPQPVVTARPSPTKAAKPTPEPTEPEPEPTEQTPQPSQPPNPVPSNTSGERDEDEE